MSKVVYLIDRSRVETREACPRKRFLNYDYAGTGLEPEEQALPLLSGIAMHTAFARLLAGQDLEQVLTDILRDYRKEIEERGLQNLDVTEDIIQQQSALLEGMLRLWARVRMPAILRDYEVISIEQAWRWELAPGLFQSFRFDVLLRRRDDGVIFIMDFKTVKYPSEVWFEKFEHNLQTCLYLQAVKERMAQLTGNADDILGGILYEGLVKGAFKKDTAQKSPWYGQRLQQSPYTLAYKLDGDQGVCVYQSDYTSKKGYRKVKTFEEMPMKNWVDHLFYNEQATVNELFIVVPDICPPAYELERVKAQVIREELQYHKQLDTYREMDPTGRFADDYLDLFAPLRTNQCYQYGADHKCPFLTVCFNRGATPLEDGGFIPRKPHHDTDLTMVA